MLNTKHYVVKVHDLI